MATKRKNPRAILRIQSLQELRERIRTLANYNWTKKQKLDVAGAIAEMLDGKEWSVETLDEIADVLRAAGYQVRDVDEADSDEANREMGLPEGEDWGNK